MRDLEHGLAAGVLGPHNAVGGNCFLWNPEAADPHFNDKLTYLRLAWGNPPRVCSIEVLRRVLLLAQIARVRLIRPKRIS